MKKLFILFALLLSVALAAAVVVNNIELNAPANDYLILNNETRNNVSSIVFNASIQAYEGFNVSNVS